MDFHENFARGLLDATSKLQRNAVSPILLEVMSEVVESVEAAKTQVLK